MDRIAIVGSAAVDRVVRGDGSAYKRGGVVVYAGLTFARLGLETRVLTNLAAGDRDVLAPLELEGVVVDVGESPATTHFINYVDGDQRRQELPVRAVPIAAAQLKALLAGVDHVYLGPLHPRDIENEALEILGPEVRVSLDLQGYVRRIEGEEVLRGVSQDLPKALACADLVKASGDELEAVLTHYGLELDELMRDCAIEEWVVTQGSRGGWVVDGGGMRTDFAPHPVEVVADPTGAGDVFFATYLFYRLHRGEQVTAAARCAAELAARQVEGHFIADEILLLERGDSLC